MTLQGDAEIAADCFHSLMTFTHPFAAEFANELRVLFETERKHPTANALSRFENGHVPTSCSPYVAPEQVLIGIAFAD
jgi:hypothetical protein